MKLREWRSAAPDLARVQTLASFIVLATLVILAQSPAELDTQLVLAGATAAVMIGAAFWRPSSRWGSIFIILLTVFTSTRRLAAAGVGGIDRLTVVPAGGLPNAAHVKTGALTRLSSIAWMAQIQQSIRAAAERLGEAIGFDDRPLRTGASEESQGAAEQSEIPNAVKQAG